MGSEKTPENRSMVKAKFDKNVLLPSEMYSHRHKLQEGFRMLGNDSADPGDSGLLLVDKKVVKK